MRECRKCGNTIPYKIIIDGKQKNLKNRKFCLSCSPFGKHNTSPNDPIKRIRTDDPEKRKEQHLLSLYKRGLSRQQELLEKSGGKCSRCGYNKCKRSLTWHHIDPSKKLFTLSLNNLWSKPMDQLLIELEKCILLCANCHGEVEQEISTTANDVVSRVNRKYGTSY